MDDKERQRLLKIAEDAKGDFTRRARTIEDFRYDEQQEKYWDITSGNLLGPKSVDGAIPMKNWPTRPDGRNGQPKPLKPSLAINDVDTGLTVEGSTWWPGMPTFIRNTVITDRGAMKLSGAVAYNSYVAPDHSDLNPQGKTAQKWINHVKRVWPNKEEHEHFFDFCAHMVQHPDEKVNHGVVMAGTQGVGKDTALRPVRRGVGIWNAAEIGPDQIHSQYNGYVRSVLLVINEVRPQEENHKASNFYNLLKPILASPPEMIGMTLKYANTIFVRNLCHVVLTTNDPLTMYIPPEDRRLFVMTSPLPDPKKKRVFADDYFDKLHEYLDEGGEDAVIRWLLKRDISDFKPASPPPLTQSKIDVIESAHMVRRTFVDEIFELYCETKCAGEQPEVFFQKELLDLVAESDLFDDARKAAGAIKAKNFHLKMAERGYVLVRNPYANEWKNKGIRSRAAFVSAEIEPQERVRMVEEYLAEWD